MRKLVCLLGLVLVVSFSAAAQDNSKGEIFAGYSYFRFDPGDGAKSVNFNGGIASFSYDIANRVAIVGELGGYHNGNVQNSGVTADAISYAFGPKFFVHKGKITPFVQGLLGGIHAKATSSTNEPVKATSLAGIVGGGVDLDVTKHFGIRLAQAEYVITRFSSDTFGNSPHQNDFRYSAGLLVHF